MELIINGNRTGTENRTIAFRMNDMVDNGIITVFEYFAG